jgi:Xaa-Pro aminopeptidase
MSSNISRLQERLSERGAAILLSEISNVQWVSGFTGSSGFVLATPGQALFISDSRYSVQAKEEVRGMDVAIYSSPMDGATFIGAEAARLGITELGFEADNVTYSQYERWKQKLAPATLKPVVDLIEPLRMIKTAEEIAKIRRACELADACFGHVVRMIQPGVRELDISLDIEFFFRRNGANLAFEPIVVSGERSARPHGRASEKKLEVGDFLTMDFGALLDGYNSDITRTVVIGEASDRHRQVYAQVLKAQLAAIEALQSGTSAASVDGLSRKVLAEQDLDKYFGHGLGHGLGKSVHDFGRLNATSKDMIAPGQVWTIEPGVYIEGFGGVRIEDDVVVTENGNEILTRSPKELMVLPVA